MTQKLFASICYALFLVLFSRFSSLNSDARRLFFAAITICGCGLKLATVGMNICVERDWVMTIAAGSQSNSSRVETRSQPTQASEERVDRILLRLNTTLRRIDLICKLVAPLFVSLLTSTVGYKFSAVVLLGTGVVTAAFEEVFVGVVYRRFPVLAAPHLGREERREPERAIGGVKGWVREGQRWIEQQVKDWNEFIRHPIFLSEFIPHS